MRRHTLTTLWLVGLLLGVGPATAQHPALGLSEANGCDVFVGQGAGQIVTPAEQFPMVDVGTIVIADRAGKRAYTLVYEGISFPPAAPDASGPFDYRGFGSWRLLEAEVRGTNQYRMVITLDPTAPGMADFVLHGEVLQGNRYQAGGSHLQGRANLQTGAYTIDFFTIVLCAR